MSVLDALVSDIKTLSPEQLCDVAAYVKEFCKGSMAQESGHELRIVEPAEYWAQIASFAEILPFGITLQDDNGQIVFSNLAAQQILGQSAAELLESAKGADAHHQGGKNFDSPFGGALDTAPVLRACLETAKGADAHHQGGMNFASPFGGALDTAPVSHAFLKRKIEDVIQQKLGEGAINVQFAPNDLQIGQRRFALACLTNTATEHHIEHRLRRQQEHREMIFKEGLAADFTWYILSDEIEAHPTFFKLHCLPPASGRVPANLFRSRILSGFLAEEAELAAAVLQNSSSIFHETCVKGDYGAVHWLEVRGVVVRDETGKPSEVHGLTVDVSARKKAERHRRETAEDLETALRFSRAAVWHWNAKTDEARWSGPVREIFGRTEAELSTFAAVKASILPPDLKTIERKAAISLATGRDIESEFRFIRPDGQTVWIAGRGGVLRDEKGEIFGIAGVNFDVSRRKKMEQELARSNRDFRELANVVPQIVFTAGPDGHIDYLNRRFFQLTGLPWGKGNGVASAIVKEDRHACRRKWAGCIRSGSPFEAEVRIWDRQLREARWYLARAVPIRDENGNIRHWFGSATEIHDQKTSAARLEHEVQCRVTDLNRSLGLLREREDELRSSLLEKDMLMREIHHRVKNNLQIISSFLRMQSATSSDSTTIAALRDAERRVASMAMIHEQLYGRSDMTIVDFMEHVSRLSQSLMASISSAQRLRCCLDLQPVDLSIEQAIPCALILNELLTNAIKHAYPDEIGGELLVKLSRQDDWVTMAVSDKGVGLPDHLDVCKPRTLGLEIVNALVRQLDGKLAVSGSTGAVFVVNFRRQVPSESQNLKEVLYEKATNRS